MAEPLTEGPGDRILREKREARETRTIKLVIGAGMAAIVISLVIIAVVAMTNAKLDADAVDQAQVSCAMIGRLFQSKDAVWAALAKIQGYADSRSDARTLLVTIPPCPDPPQEHEPATLDELRKSLNLPPATAPRRNE